MKLGQKITFSEVVAYGIDQIAYSQGDGEQGLYNWYLFCIFAGGKDVTFFFASYGISVI